MPFLAYMILGILVERFKQRLADPGIDPHLSFSAIWKRIDDAGYTFSCTEMQQACAALVDGGYVEKERDFWYAFRVTRIAFPKTA